MSIETETKKEFKNTKALVKILMTNEERCRNDDKYLVFRVLEEITKSHGQKLFVPFELFNDFPSYETISRVRRYWQNKKGELLPTNPQVLLRRQRREKAVREWAVGK